MNGAQHCPECGSKMSVKDTGHGGMKTFRIAECKCGIRVETEECQVRRLPARMPHMPGMAPARVEAPIPQPEAANPPVSAGGVGGVLPVESLQPLSKPDPNPQASLLSVPRARARNKTPANGPHREMVAEFVERWEDQYQDKYPFEPAEGAQVANLIKKHPHLVERWPDMVARYLATAYWASKRHPLMILVTRPVEFSGEAGAPVSQKWSDSRRTAINWAHRKEAAE